MTTKQTAKAATDAKPEAGQVVTYIDWEGKKLHGKSDAKPVTKTEAKPE